MKQLDLQLRNPRHVNVDGMFDERTRTQDGYRIRYIGEAVQMFDGTYCCLADVQGNLCRVEVIIKEASRAG